MNTSESEDYMKDFKIRERFIVEDSELEKDVGRLCQVEISENVKLGKVVAIQRLWDYDENGVYRSGCLGYTVKLLKEEYQIIDGEKYRFYHFPIAFSQRSVKFNIKD